VRPLPPPSRPPSDDGSGPADAAAVVRLAAAAPAAASAAAAPGPRRSKAVRSLATLCTFAASGLFHELMFYYFASPYVWGIIKFFLVQVGRRGWAPGDRAGVWPLSAGAGGCPPPPGEGAGGWLFWGVAVAGHIAWRSIVRRGVV
jgi:hypothetical protein